MKFVTASPILDQNMCDLKLTLKKSWVYPYIKQLYSELKLKGIPFKPFIWVSDDWFSPDGTAGFAIPFYIIHRDLLRLERKMIGYAEGSTPKSLMMLLRHETAHALDNAFHLRKNKTRQKLFGKTSRPYPTSYKPVDNTLDFVVHLPDHYAQAHPDEDWAETFAVWLNPQSNWQTKYKNTKALEKLQLVDKVMQNLPAQRCFNKLACDDISHINKTLREHYREKQRRLRLRKSSPIYQSLKKELSKQGKTCAFTFVSKNKFELSNILAKKTGLPHNKSMSIVKELKDCCQEEAFFLDQNESLDWLVSKLASPHIIKHHQRVIM